jgi:acyl-CoA thioester hydrolase
MRMNFSTQSANAQRFVPSETVLYVRFADVDMMQVVHHGAYLHWFEQIRFHFLNEILGLSLERLIAENVALPLTQCDLQFRRAIRFGQRLAGYARAEIGKQALIKLNYAIYDQDSGELMTTGSTTHCFLGPQLRLLLRAPAFFAEAVAGALSRFPDGMTEASES